MRARTFTLLGTAAICATVAVFLTRDMMAGRAEKVQIVERRVIPKTLNVVVAKSDLAFGTRLKPAMLKIVQWPVRLAPTGVFSSIADLVGNGGRVVLGAISTGEPILTAKVTKPGQQASLSTAIAKAMLAVTIRVDDVNGVGGFVQPDDRVDIMLTRRAFKGKAGEVQASEVYTDVLLQNIRVLAVGQKLDRSTKVKQARTVTLEVDRVRAQKLVLAASVGTLSLALRNTTSVDVGKSRRISLNDLPQPPAGQRAGIKPETKPLGPIVTIVRGTADRKRYEVLPDVADPSASKRPLGTSPKPNPPANISNDPDQLSAPGSAPSVRDWALTRPVAVIPAVPEVQKKAARPPLPNFVVPPQ
jgi:pilus assembly protein CpaB